MMLYLFFAAIGTSNGDILTTVRSPYILPYLIYISILYTIHFLTIYTFGHVIGKKSLQDIVICSNANIGNAATATALAASLKWTDKVG
jgi:uncharacterized membrane protein